MVYDATHARGVGLSARHTVGPGQNAYYRWNRSFSGWSNWYGRVYVWFDRDPAGDLRLIRSKDTSGLGFAVDLLRSGQLRVKDSLNRSVAQTRASITTGAWVRIEWHVDLSARQVEVRLYNSPNSTVPTEAIVTATGIAIPTIMSEIQIGRSGSQSFSAVFWTDDPGISSLGFLGPV